MATLNGFEPSVYAVTGHRFKPLSYRANKTVLFYYTKTENSLNYLVVRISIEVINL